MARSWSPKRQINRALKPRCPVGCCTASTQGLLAQSERFRGRRPLAAIRTPCDGWKDPRISGTPRMAQSPTRTTSEIHRCGYDPSLRHATRPSYNPEPQTSPVCPRAGASAPDAAHRPRLSSSHRSRCPRCRLSTSFADGLSIRPAREPLIRCRPFHPERAPYSRSAGRS